MHLISKWASKLSKKDASSAFSVHLAKRLFGRLIQSESLEDMTRLVIDATIVFCSTKITDEVKAALERLTQAVNTFKPANLLSSITEGHENYPCEDENDNENCDENCNGSELPKELSNQLKNCLFMKHCNSIVSKAKDELSSSKSAKDLLDNKYFFPSFLDHIHSNYLQFCPLWSKIAFSRATDDFETKRSDKLGCRTIKSNADTNAQVEEFFWIKKRTTFRNVPRADLTEFIRDNNEDNSGMMRQFSDGLLVELEKVKGKSALSSMVKVAEEHLRENSKDEKDSDVKETYVPQPEEEWKDKKSKSNIGKRKRQRGEYQVPPDVPLLFDPTVPPIPEGSAPRSKNAFQEFENKHWDNIAKEKKNDNDAIQRTLKEMWNVSGKKNINRNHEDVPKCDTEDQSNIYECTICEAKSRRNEMVFCGICQRWLHEKCCGFSAKLAPKLPAYTCTNCVRNSFGIFHNYYAFHKKSELRDSTEISEICRRWNILSLSEQLPWGSYHPFLGYGSIFTDDDIQFSQRGFKNVLSNCWISSILQLVHATPLQKIVNELSSMEEFEDKTTLLLSKIFREMQAISDSPIGIDMLTELANQVRMPLKFREHQDCVEFYYSLLERIENEISSVHVDSLTYFAFSHQLLTTMKCLYCDKLSILQSFSSSIELSVPDLKVNESVPVFSLLWNTMTTGICDDEDSMCLHCKKKGLIHQNVILAKAPEILTLALNRNKYHGTLSDLVIDTPIKIECILNVSDIVMGTEPHAVLEYTLIGVLEKGDSIDSGHFVTYIIHSDEV